MNTGNSMEAAGPEAELTTSAQGEVRDFATSLIDVCGGMVEWRGNEGAALLPAEVASLLHTPETVRLTSQHEPGSLCISLGSDFLDLAEGTLDSLVARVGSFQVPDPYLKKGALQSAIDRAFAWNNARVRVRGTEPKFTVYHNWRFFASLKSEDIWEGRVGVSLNSATRAPVELPDVLELWELEPDRQAFAVAPEETFAAAVRIARTQLLSEAASFLARMQSRLARDRKRLRDYYGALSREAGATKRRGATPPTKEQIDAGKRAVALELDRKLLELLERYQIEASLEPLVLACVGMNALTIELWVQRKRAERLLRLYWNPILKQLEPLACSACGVAIYSVFFTDEAVLPVCSQCHGVMKA